MADTLPMRETPIPPSTCVRCGLVHELATGVTTGGRPVEAPRPGDLSVCVGCGSAQVFDEGLRVRLLTAEERWGLSGDE